MHEYAVVEDLVETIKSRATVGGSQAVKSIRLRRDSTFAEEPLRQAFTMLTEHTPLESATLEIDELTVTRACPDCRKRHTIMAHDLIGHLYLCPDCGCAEHIDEAHGLELLEIVFA